MHELLSKMIGQEVDVVCVGSTTLRGKVINVEDGVLHLKDDENEICYLAIDKIVTVWEKRDRDRQPGFVGKS